MYSLGRLVTVFKTCYTIYMNTLVYHSVSFVFILTLLSAPTLTQAADKSNDEGAFFLIQSQRSLTLKTLEHHRFGIGIKNTSGRTWQKNEPFALRSKARHESYFYHPSWKEGTVVTGLPYDVPSGHVVYFWFTLEAPKTPGSYTEEFTLSRGETLFSKTVTRIPITVVAGSVAHMQNASSSAPPLAATPVPIAAIAPSSVSDVRLTALTLIKSASSLTMKQYERRTFGIGYKNTSGRPWRMSDGITLRSNVARESYFYDATWIGGNAVMRLPQEVQPGELVYFWLTLFAPIYPRDFQEHLYLAMGDKKIEGSDVTIPITVAPASSSILASTPAHNAAGSTTLIETQLPDATAAAPIPSLAHPPRPGIVEEKTDVEPFIRVGLYHTIEPVRLTASKEYEVRDVNGTLIATVPPGAETTITFDFSAKQYTVTTPTITTTTNMYLRLRGTILPYRIVTRDDGSMAVEPVADQDIIFEVRSFINNPSWSTTVNDNLFRGEMEVRYAHATDRLWVVNELLFEQYMKGIAETSNTSPYEYQKALIIAARTYAKHHIDRNLKHAREGFTVRPTEADQVYRGYNSEKRMPTIARAVEETRGVMVHYDGALAITPYSSNTDGRTRSWEEVWGGPPKPWLVSVPDPCCTGLSMRYSPTSYSHGVGMSARGALAMALDNKGFEEIVKYYYTNIELIRKY